MWTFGEVQLKINTYWFKTKFRNQDTKTLLLLYPVEKNKLFSIKKTKISIKIEVKINNLWKIKTINNINRCPMPRSDSARAICFSNIILSKIFDSLQICVLLIFRYFRLIGMNTRWSCFTFKVKSFEETSFN